MVITYGFLYKFILAHIFNNLLLIGFRIYALVRRDSHGTLESCMLMVLISTLRYRCHLAVT